MLGKLIKHEFKATSRMFLPLLVITAIMTPLSAIMMRLGFREVEGGLLSSLLSGSFTALYVITLIGVGMASTIILIIRFYRSMVTDQGYLTHTLPAKTSDIIWSKFIVSYVWFLVSGILIVISILCLTKILGLWTFSGLFDALKQFGSVLTHYEINLWPIILSTILLLLVSIANSLLHYFTAVSLGQLMKGHRVLGAIVSYIGIYIVVQVITTIFTSFSVVRLERMSVEIETAEDLARVSDNGAAVLRSAVGYIWLAIGFIVVLDVVYFLITNYVFKKKLNLE